MAQVSLQSVANDTFPAVRANINSQLAALYSNNSGSSAPVNPVPYQLWADTTANLLKIRNAANSAWITIGALETANLGLAVASGGVLTSPSVTGGTFGSPALTGTPTCPTAAVDTSTTQVASTAFVQANAPCLLLSMSGSIAASGAQGTYVAQLFQPPATCTVEKNKGFTVNTSTATITVPSSGVYLVTSSCSLSWSTTTGFKEIVLFAGYNRNGVNTVAEVGRLSWAAGYGDNTAYSSAWGGAITFPAALAAGDAIRPTYGAIANIGAVVAGFSPITFAINRIG